MAILGIKYKFVNSRGEESDEIFSVSECDHSEYLLKRLLDQIKEDFKKWKTK